MNYPTAIRAIRTYVLAEFPHLSEVAVHGNELHCKTATGPWQFCGYMADVARLTFVTG